jgi:predicted nucleic acid-binding protein
MIVIADTSPLNYLVLIGAIDVLPTLYQSVVIPKAVFAELHTEDTPHLVKEWIDGSPSWLEVKQAVETEAALPATLGAGEREAIVLAQQLTADALIIDDRDGRKEAMQRGIKVIGTLGILNDAAIRGLIDLPTAITKLQQTSFRASAKLITVLLEQDAKRKLRRRFDDILDKVPDVESEDQDRIE